MSRVYLFIKQLLEKLILWRAKHGAQDHWTFWHCKSNGNKMSRKKMLGVFGGGGQQPPDYPHLQTPLKTIH
jgi:hypothetical protein